MRIPVKELKYIQKSCLKLEFQFQSEIIPGLHPKIGVFPRYFDTIREVIPVGVMLGNTEGGVVEYDGESSEMTVKNDKVKPQTIVENLTNNTRIRI